VLYFNWILIALGIVLVVGFGSLALRSRRSGQGLRGNYILYLDAVLALGALALVVGLLREVGTSPSSEVGASTPAAQTATPTVAPPPSPTATPSPTLALPTPTPTPTSTTYIVKEGDTLITIAEAFGITLGELQAANPTVSPVSLQLKQELVIPNRKSPAELTATAVPISTPTLEAVRVQTITYVVRMGDTPADIAMRYGSTAEAIMQANGLSDPSMLQIGQVLVIPLLATPRPPGGVP
ncbi:MAG: LysM peptidoglycan-binding domain-containing protein, partial [Chloroflexota bacterium]|nr:LysM peptidoglycan-binding domain-containing protein [Chloroflexota bacterium]